MPDHLRRFREVVAPEDLSNALSRDAEHLGDVDGPDVALDEKTANLD